MLYIYAEKQEDRKPFSPGRPTGNPSLADKNMNEVRQRIR